MGGVGGSGGVGGVGDAGGSRLGWRTRRSKDSKNPMMLDMFGIALDLVG